MTPAELKASADTGATMRKAVASQLRRKTLRAKVKRGLMKRRKRMPTTKGEQP